MEGGKERGEIERLREEGRKEGWRGNEGKEIRDGGREGTRGDGKTVEGRRDGGRGDGRKEGRIMGNGRRK